MSGESMDTSEKTYGGCEGPDAMYVKLISSDGRKFKYVFFSKIGKKRRNIPKGTFGCILHIHCGKDLHHKTAVFKRVIFLIYGSFITCEGVVKWEYNN